MDTRNSVWTLRDANNSNNAATRSRPETEQDEDSATCSSNTTTTCCSEENLLNSPFESFSPSSRCKDASSHGRRRSTTRGQNDGGDTSPRVAHHRHRRDHRHHQRETSKMPTTASHPKSTTAFRQLSDLLWQAQLNSVARRNERERKRVKLVNNGFAALRQKIPSSGKIKADYSSKSSKASKLSKVETLRSAIKYINHLQYLLKECEPNNDSINTEATRLPPPRVSNSEPYSDNESLNYNTDSSVFSDNTNIIITAHKEECITTKHSDEKFSYSGYEPNLDYGQSHHVSNVDSYQNYHCYTTVAQNELFCSW